MDQKQNPYQTNPGFGLRYHHARKALEKFGKDYNARPYSRGFDNCFENFDGDAVVWALMHEAIECRNEYLAEGIKRMGENVWPRWLEAYEQRGKYAPKQEQLNLFVPTQRKMTPTKPPMP